MSETDTPVYRIGDRIVDGWGRDAEEPAGEGQDYSTWSAKQLTAEIEKRNADRDEADHIVLEGKKKADAVSALEADDEAHAEE